MAKTDASSEPDDLDGLTGLGGEEEAGGGDEELDPLAQEMLKMMEEEGGEGTSQEDVDRMMEAEMLKAMEAEGGFGGAGAAAAKSTTGLPSSVSRLMDVVLTVTIELGRAEETLEHVLAFGEQSLVELNKQVGDPVDVLVNGKLFARGEVVTVSENFGVRITELLPGVIDP